MQLLPPLTRDAARRAAREQPAGKHLPYARHVDDHTIETRDGLLMQVIHLRGLLFETADTDEINYRKRLRDAMLQAIGSSRFAIYHHIVRRRIDAELSADHPDAFSRQLDAAWRARLAAKRLYVNDLFLTLIRRPLQGRVGGSTGCASGSAAAPPSRPSRRGLRAAPARRGARRPARRARQLRAAAARRLRDAAGALLRAARIPLRALQWRDAAGAAADAGSRRLSALSPDQLRPGDGRARPGRRQPRAASSASSRSRIIRARPRPGMLDELLRLPFELTVSQSFGFVERQAALSRMNLALRRMRSAEDEAVSLRAELANAKDEVAAGRAGFGEHHMTIAVRADTPGAVDEGVAEVQAALADLGIIAVREEIALEPAFWAQFPGNFKYIARRGLVSTGNFAGLASGHNFPLGQADGNHWGEAVTLLETTAAGPYYFNFHQGDLGNFTVIGPSGLGQDGGAQLPARPGAQVRSRGSSSSTRTAAPSCSSARSAGATTCCGRATPAGLNPLQLADNAGQPPVPDRLAAPCSPGGADIDEDRADQGRGRRQFRAAGRASPPAPPRRAVPRRPPAARRRPLVAARGPGGATASAPGCSTTSAT